MHTDPTPCACGCGEHAKPGNRFIHGHNSHRSHIKYVVGDGGCWNWTGSHWRNGYGRMKVKGRWRQAHRIYWERENGPVPDGRELDHVCCNKTCVNPAHLEPVTHAENMRRWSQHYRSTRIQNTSVHG